MFTFTRLDHIPPTLVVSKLVLPELDQQQRLFALRGIDGGMFFARFRGGLQARFGQPLHVSTESSLAYEYALQATNVDGQKWVLTAYQGASGPAIGGNSHDATNRAAAVALMHYILSTPPADFDAVLYDSDVHATMFYGCQGGQCYYREQRGDRRSQYP